MKELHKYYEIKYNQVTKELAVRYVISFSLIKIEDDNRNNTRALQVFFSSYLKE